MHAALHDKYPERLHHPKEDELSLRLVKRHPQARKLVDELQAEPAPVSRHSGRAGAAGPAQSGTEPDPAAAVEELIKTERDPRWLARH